VRGLLLEWEDIASLCETEVELLMLVMFCQPEELPHTLSRKR
jgi:hypothetical protein